MESRRSFENVVEGYKTALKNYIKEPNPVNEFIYRDLEEALRDAYGLPEDEILRIKNAVFEGKR